MSEIWVWLGSNWYYIVLLIAIFGLLDFGNRLAVTIGDFQLLLEVIRDNLYDANNANDVYERLKMKAEHEMDEAGK